MMPELDDEPEADMISCYICDCEWDENTEDRPCDCCYDCERMSCVCGECLCDECDEYESECTCRSRERSRPPVQPLRRRSPANMPSGVRVQNSRKQRFGIEIETSDLDRNYINLANAMWRNALPIKDVRTSTVDMLRVVEDGSIRGSDRGEIVSQPVSFLDHYRLLLACTMGMEESLSFDWPALHGKPQSYLLKLLESMVAARFDGTANQDGFNQFSTLLPASNTWYNESCGMHITTCQMNAEPLTWVKLAYFLNNCSSEDYVSLGGRASSQYLQQRTYGMRHFAQGFRCTTRGFASTDGESSSKYSPLHFKLEQNLMEFRLFRSSANPMRILSNMQMTQVWLDYFRQCPMRTAPLVTACHIGAYLSKHKHVYPFAAWAMCQPVHEMVAQGFRLSNVSPLPFTP